MGLQTTADISKIISHYFAFYGLEIFGLGLGVVPLVIIILVGRYSSTDLLFLAFFLVLLVLGIGASVMRRKNEKLIAQYLRGQESPVVFRDLETLTRQTPDQIRSLVIRFVIRYKLPGLLDLANGIFYPKKGGP